MLIASSLNVVAPSSRGKSTKSSERERESHEVGMLSQETALPKVQGSCDSDTSVGLQSFLSQNPAAGTNESIERLSSTPCVRKLIRPHAEGCLFTDDNPAPVDGNLNQ